MTVPVFHVEGDVASLRLGECTLRFEREGLLLEGCGAAFSGEYRGERWRRYVYLEVSGNKLGRGELEVLCGRRGGLVRGSFLVSCVDSGVGGIVIVVTPGFFLYERAIVSPGLVTVEFIGEKTFVVERRGGGALWLGFRRPR